MKARIKRLSAEAPLPQYHTQESAAFDFTANADASIAPGEIGQIPTGLVIEAPKGHFLMIAARSSLGLKKGLQLKNGIGVVDRDFSGPTDEIHIILFNASNQTAEIKKGERIAQGIFIKIDQVEWKEVEEIRKADRGGYGSTGGYHN